MTATAQLVGSAPSARADHPMKSTPGASARRQESDAVSDTADSQDSENSKPEQDSSFHSVLQQLSSTPNSERGSAVPVKGKGKDKKNDTSVAINNGKDEKPTADLTVPAPVVESPREPRPLHLALPFHISIPQESYALDASSDQDESKGQDTSSLNAGSKDSASTKDAAVEPAPQQQLASATQPDDLAFAARLTQDHASSAAAEATSGSKSRSQLTAQSNQKQNSAFASVVADATPAPKTSAALSTEPSAKAALLTPSTSSPSYAATSAAPKAAAPEMNGTAARVQELVDAKQASAGPLHQITIRIPDATERGTDVRFIERAGEVHVSVRTGDSETAQNLRGGLNDLVSSLDHSGIRAEVWRPGSDASQSDSQQPSDQQQQSKQGGRQHSGDSRESQQERSRPEWVEQMESSFAISNKSAAA